MFTADNETIEIRDGEELEVGRLGRYLSSRLSINESEVQIAQFPAGSSNLTYLVRVGDAEFVLRRPPFGNTVKTAHDMRREFDALSKLSKVYPPAPKPSLFCDDESVIGSEFYLMERRNGLIIRGRVSSPTVREGTSDKTKLSAQIDELDTSQDFRLAVTNNFIRNLAELHSLDYNSAGLGDLGKPEGYNRRQVEGWTKRYFTAQTDEYLQLEKAIEWLNENIPSEFGASLIHNDYKFDNIMLDLADLTRITALLDWEMVTIGNPLMDLGTTLGYWMSVDAGDEMLNMPFNPRVLMENVSRQQLVDFYSEAFGRKLPDMLFYYVFGTFKIAVICQQIYARYVKGFTQDKRFANFNVFVATLGRIADQALERGNI